MSNTLHLTICLKNVKIVTMTSLAFWKFKNFHKVLRFMIPRVQKSYPKFLYGTHEHTFLRLEF